METPWTTILEAIGPFVLLLGLWFFLFKLMRNQRHSVKKTYIDPMQDMIRADILPEIRLLRESIDKLRNEIKARDERSGP
jgi:hypothetical protein